MSFLGDVFDFEKFNLKGMWEKIKDDPERLFLGAADPFGSELWGGILGKKYEPIINQMGGASDDTYDKAKAAGINTGPGKNMHDLASVIASIYTGKWLGGMMPQGGTGGSTGGFDITKFNPSSLTNLMPQSQQAQSGLPASHQPMQNQSPGSMQSLAVPNYNYSKRPTLSDLIYPVGE